MSRPDPQYWKILNAKIVEEFRANDGKVGGELEGANLLLLTTTGARSGQARLSPLAYHCIDGKMLIVGGYAGADVHPAWVFNLRAHPQARVEVGTQSFDVVAHELPPEQRAAAFAEIVATTPLLAEYQTRTTRVIPIFELQQD